MVRVSEKLLEIVKAAAEGKQIQYRESRSKEWKPLLSCKFSGALEYRVKPPKRIEPYSREFWETIHSVRAINTSFVHAVLKVYSEGIEVAGYPTCTFRDALELFTNLDGTPCGVEVEE